MDKIDTIERTVTIAGSIQRVWEALTVADQLMQWFGDSAALDLKPGGSMRVGWSEHDVVVDCVVEEVDPPSTFSYRWNSGSTDDGQGWTTKVRFSLAETAAGETTVTVVESGLSLLPDELYHKTLEENTSGWGVELADLQRLLEGAAAR